MHGSHGLALRNQWRTTAREAAACGLGAAGRSDSVVAAVALHDKKRAVAAPRARAEAEPRAETGGPT